jgi:hypothetical protein
MANAEKQQGVSKVCPYLFFFKILKNNFQHLSKTKQYACSALICVYLLIAFHSSVE